MKLLWILLGATLLTNACATLNTSGMSAQCRDLYNACLNSCPQQSRRVAGTGLDSLSKSPSAIDSGGSLDTGTAACTHQCNATAKACERPSIPQ